MIEMGTRSSACLVIFAFILSDCKIGNCGDVSQARQGVDGRFSGPYLVESVSHRGKTMPDLLIIEDDELTRGFLRELFEW